MLQENILVLDFGSQYTQLIARRIRENHVFCQILPYNVSINQIKEYSPKGLIFSGGPASVYDKEAPLPDEGVFDLNIPILGICYGMQIIAHIFGGKVQAADRREYGKTGLIIDDDKDLFFSLAPTLTCWMSHSDRVSKLPPNFMAIAHTDNAYIAAIANRKQHIFGIQFHPEVIHTDRGNQILANFLFKICTCSGNWTMESFIETAVNGIRESVGEKKVICGLSGGVDSSVTAILVHKAIGNKLTCVFINNGLLRKNESERVRETFQNYFHINLISIDAEERFLTKLKGLIDPEEKRRIIGNEFIKVFEDEARKIGDVEYLAQGTLYPDCIESTSAFGGPSARIKTHHNVGGLPLEMKLKLIEPLKYLFKDEVRMVGEKLGLPDSIIWRQPFPGPGLAVRIIGEVTKERLDILREVDEKVLEEIKKAGLYREIWQSFAILLPIKSVGVMGDGRTYENVVALRCVTSSDGMTADWAKLPYEVLEKISNRIINEVKGVNRVAYDISSKPPATIEWE